jgi:energy-coupling factor transport system permease protein
VTWLSIKFGIGRGIKLAELLAASVLFLSTTKIEEFTYGLQRMRVPYRVSFAISLSFRLVPLFIDSAVTIVDAQRLRGYDFNQGGPLERVRRYVPVVIPVFMGALRKANNMAMALEARGFGFSHEPTTFIEYPVTGADVMAFAFLIGLGALYFMLYFTGLGGIGPVK